MEESPKVRQSGRRRVRPLEFWNFEKPENSASKPIIYNEFELTKHSIFKSFSLSYYGSPPKSSTCIKEKPKSPNVATKRGKDHSTNSSKNSTCSSKSRGRKRKLESIEPPRKDGAHSVVSDEDPLGSTRLGRKKDKVGGQEPPGKEGAHPVSSGEDPLCSLRVAGKKQKLVEKERSGDEGYSTLSEDPLCSTRIAGQRQKSESKELQKQKVKSTTTLNSEESTRWAAEETHEYTNNRQEDASVVLPSKNKSKFCGSFFNDSNGQHIKSIYMRNLNLTEKDITQNTTAFEPPSFRSVFSSTAIEAPEKTVFKVPRLPSLRRPPLSMLKVSSQCLDPSMVTIPEEEEQQQHQEKKEKEKHKQEQKNTEQQQQQHKEKQGDRQEKEENEQMEVEKVLQQSQEKPDDGDATATTSTRVTLVPQSHEQGRDHQGQEDTLTRAALNPRRSSRVRTKPLEYWNFEKVEVERREDGEVRVVHQKQGSNHLIQTRVMDCSVALGSQPGQGITLSDDLLRDTTEALIQRSKVASHIKGRPRISPKKSLRTGTRDGVHPALSPAQGKRMVDAQNLISSWSPNCSPKKSPTKRKLFSPKDNFYEEPVEEESKVTKIRVGGKTVTLVGRVRFSDLQFIVLEKKDYRCYVGHAIQNKDKNIFASYLFLERGQIMWNNSRKLIVFVMQGHGMLKVMKEEEGKSYSLKPNVTVECQKASKLSLKKDGRCKMLKLHLCWVGAAKDKCK